MEISIVVPVYNEQECIEASLREVLGVLDGMDGSVEVLAVDDGSSDGTAGILRKLAAEEPRLRVLRLNPNSGQSAALGTGFRHAKGQVIVMLDADGQNDPADIPKLVGELKDCDMCCGYRANRQDTWARRYGSKLANWCRDSMLGDGIRDTGCTIRAVKAEYLRDQAVWHGMHRFIPALAIMNGARIKQIPVNHRARTAGTSKYTNFGRLRVTIADLFAVRWMQKRHRRFQVEETGGMGNH